MLATQERVRTPGGTVIVWHKAAEPERCNGECDWHPIACSKDEGIAAPGGLRDVPLDLDEPGQRWCADCLGIIRAEEAVKSSAESVNEGLDSLFRKLGPPPDDK